MTTRYFDDFNAGDVFVSPGMTITESAIVDFASQWDPQPFHIDADFARTEGNYGGLIASGMHTMVVTLKLWLSDGILKHCTIGSPGLDSIRFPLPVRPGDTLRVTTEFLETRASASKPDRGIVKVRHVTRNQRGEVVLTMDANVILTRRLAGS